MADNEFAPDDAVPFHFNLDGQPCSGSGVSSSTGQCPNGCDHADHYANDGHRDCEVIADVEVIDPRQARNKALAGSRRRI